MDALPLSFRVLATVLHALIFLLGAVGNTLLIVVARKSVRLRTPTYTYLVSLAYADLLVIWCAIPEAILSYHIGNRWIFGQGPCAIFIFLNFLGINAGSLIMLAFTVERYLATCHPFHARFLCTVSRTKRVICGVWTVALVYCAPWLGLTEVKQDEFNPLIEQCGFRLSADVYLIVFMADLVLFYILPLMAVIILYTKICLMMKEKRPARCENISAHNVRPPLQRSLRVPSTESPTHNSSTESVYSLANIYRRSAPVPKMLIVVVAIFAIAWLPYRGLLVYNSFVEEPWLNIWYVLFAKTAIYLNSAINPLLYNIMSARFRDAVKEYLGSSKATMDGASIRGLRVGTTEVIRAADPVQHRPAPDARQKLVVTFSNTSYQSMTVR
ncbi:thyrotropin-releasing hormone receptor-like [Paramacrobiotus metropolitanus]|uniref:thyrotropin-releasing hormone receptor-like n=1 Tax=Paramacrobiotus metropolitanus TaxID=2943436 RepID=UPI0024459330|nr:thyrotropin-releasing hormone receptor-like [Paramacrobiotus metropolitanus]